MTIKVDDRIEFMPSPVEQSGSGRTVVSMFPQPKIEGDGQQPVSRRYWLAVACAKHVRIGRANGFMQVNHGKEAPLKRIKPGDGIVYYSPSVAMGEKDGFQHFTAIGYVADGEPYRALMMPGQPWRRNVDWLDAPEQPLLPLLGWLDFTQEKNWGYRLRRGLVSFGQTDFEFLEEIMTSELEIVKRRRSQVS
jgi:hypothetical protein